MVGGLKIDVEVHELVFGRDKCRHARGVPGFARIPCPASEVCLRIIDIHPSSNHSPSLIWKALCIS